MHRPINQTLPIPSRLRHGLLLFALPLTLRTFQYFPGMALIQEAWFIVIIFGSIGLLISYYWKNQIAFQGFEIYLIILAVLGPIWSALAALSEFGQPLIYGLLTQRVLVMATGIPILLHYCILSHYITFRDIKSALIVLAWTTLGLYSFMNLFLDPTAYFDQYGVGFVNSPASDSRFVLDGTFIGFGLLYYTLKGLKENNGFYYACSACFFFYLLVVGRGRATILAVLFSILIVSFRFANNKAHLIKFILRGAIGISLTLFGIFILNHDFFVSMFSKFADAFTVVLTGEMTDDSSANARIIQTTTALPYIIKNLWVGSGQLSNQWNSGFQNVLGYFYPGDIGLIGVVFLYGVLGTAIFLIQFMFAIVFARRRFVSMDIPQDLIQTVKAFILSLGIISISTGHFLHRIDLLLFLIGILWTATETKYRALAISH